MKEYYLCKLHNEVFGGAETRINTECFLPVWEGGSVTKQRQVLKYWVSSLYGRVDRSILNMLRQTDSFLPVWEGGSKQEKIHVEHHLFPPCMGGWIVEKIEKPKNGKVSSLYGRVDRKTYNNVEKLICFLPVWEGSSGKVFL